MVKHQDDDPLWVSCFCCMVPVIAALQGALLLIPNLFLLLVAPLLASLLHIPFNLYHLFPAIVRTNHLGPFVKCLSVVFVLVPALVWPAVVAVVGAVTAVCWSFLGPLPILFDERKELCDALAEVPRKSSEWLQDFWQWSFVSWPEQVDQWAREPDDDPFEINPIILVAGLVIMAFGVACDVPAVVVIGLVKLIPGIFRHYHMLWTWYGSLWKRCGKGDCAAFVMIVSFPVFILCNLGLPFAGIILYAASILYYGVFLGLATIYYAWKYSLREGIREIYNVIYVFDEDSDTVALGRPFHRIPHPNDCCYPSIQQSREERVARRARSSKFASGSKFSKRRRNRAARGGGGGGGGGGENRQSTAAATVTAVAGMVGAAAGAGFAAFKKARGGSSAQQQQQRQQPAAAAPVAGVAASAPPAEHAVDVAPAEDPYYAGTAQYYERENAAAKQAAAARATSSSPRPAEESAASKAKARMGGLFRAGLSRAKALIGTGPVSMDAVWDSFFEQSVANGRWAINAGLLQPREVRDAQRPTSVAIAALNVSRLVQRSVSLGAAGIMLPDGTDVDGPRRPQNALGDRFFGPLMGMKRVAERSELTLREWAYVDRLCVQHHKVVAMPPPYGADPERLGELEGLAELILEHAQSLARAPSFPRRWKGVVAELLR